MRYFLFWFLAIVFNCAFADEGFLVEEVAQGIFVHRGLHQDIDEGYSGDICNISFIVGQEGVAVIDTGGSPHIGRALLAAIRQRTDKPIKFVINTHVHPDHVFGKSTKSDEYDAKKLIAGLYTPEQLQPDKNLGRPVKHAKYPSPSPDTVFGVPTIRYFCECVLGKRGNLLS